MPNLARIDQRPDPARLSPEERRTLEKHFDANAYEVNIDGHRVAWDRIEEVEAAKAAREGGPAGWVVKNLVFGGDRYHVALYFGRDEAVLTNVTLETARFAVQTIAYYAKQTIRYTGPDDIVTVAGS